jgi:hypothetical protein
LRNRHDDEPSEYLDESKKNDTCVSFSLNPVTERTYVLKVLNLK